MAFRVRRGDKVVGVTGVVVTTKLGRVAVRRRAILGEGRLRVAPGDDVYILNYVGEGYWTIWVRGEVMNERLAEKPADCDADPECSLEIVEGAETTWWVKVRDQQGREGWTRQVENFGDIDACG
jgi:hypothetical protein